MTLPRHLTAESSFQKATNHSINKLDRLELTSVNWQQAENDRDRATKHVESCQTVWLERADPNQEAQAHI